MKYSISSIHSIVVFLFYKTIFVNVREQQQFNHLIPFSNNGYRVDVFLVLYFGSHPQYKYSKVKLFLNNKIFP